MTRPQPLPARQSIFRHDEPILQSTPLLEDAVSPLFGESGVWDFNGVVRRPANLLPGSWRLPFTRLSPLQSLLAREICMIEFNPRHPAVLAAGIHIGATPRKIGTARSRMTVLRALAEFSATKDLPEDFGQWATSDFHLYLKELIEGREGSTAAPHVVTIKNLHRFASALSSGGLSVDPWPGQTATKILEIPTGAPLKTPVIAPETWFPLIRSAWTYIDTFGPDILRARAAWQELQAGQRRMSLAEARQRCDEWLADPSNRVPIWAPQGSVRAKSHTTTINWSLVAAMIGVHKDTRVFAPTEQMGRMQRARVEEAVAAGRVQFGLLRDVTEVDRPDGTRGPWSVGLHPHALWIEYTALRNAAYVFVTAMSMMRDSEVRDILKGSVVEHYGSPAVKSTKEKLDPDLPVKHWWIIEPAAQAIKVAAELSLHDEFAFGSVQAKSPTRQFGSAFAINSFTRQVNKNRHVTGLPQIPKGKLSPHMFRRTMAMLTREFPGSEIASGMQLKHVATRALANTTTQQYGEASPAWARYLTTAIAERRFERLKELFDADGRGESIGFGPGADRMREAFAAVRAKAEALRATNQAQRGDLRVEHDLLRRTHLSIRFGKLNHCTLDDNNPVGAKCLEEAVIPDGHKGPLIDRCQPARCANSIIAPTHLPIWTAERAALQGLLANSKVPPNRRALLTEHLKEVNLVIRKADQ